MKQKAGQNEWKRYFGAPGESMRSSVLIVFFIFERKPALEKSSRDATLRSNGERAFRKKSFRGLLLERE